MNKPYTCHNCGTVVEAYPDALKQADEKRGQTSTHTQVICPGCVAAKKTPIERTYTLNIEGDLPVLASSPWSKNLPQP